jgi:hypothetical protein
MWLILPPVKSHRHNPRSSDDFILSKVELLPHYSGFLMQSGGSAWTPTIIAMAGFLRTTDDHLIKLNV